jgi:uncharacterized protein (TIGR00369 family)
MIDLLAAVIEAKRSGDYRGLVEAIPYAQFLGLATANDGEGLVTTMRYAAHLIGNPALPALHGGTIGALLESAAIFELICRAEIAVLPKTITFTVEYLRPGAPVDTHARAAVTRLGRRVANVRVEAWQADRGTLVATAAVAFLTSGRAAAGGPGSESSAASS